MLLELIVSISILTTTLILNTLLITTLMTSHHKTQQLETTLRTTQNQIETTLASPIYIHTQLDPHHLIEYKNN